MLRVGESTEDPSGILGIDSRRKQVTLIDPGGIGSNAGVTPEERRVAVSAPKMFAFDGIFGDEDDQVRNPEVNLKFKKIGNYRDKW